MDCVFNFQHTQSKLLDLYQIIYQINIVPLNNFAPDWAPAQSEFELVLASKTSAGTLI